MSIIDNRTSGLVKFHELKIGEYFENNGEIYLKITGGDNIYNSFNCCKRVVGCVSLKSDCVPLNTDLIIKDNG